MALDLPSNIVNALTITKILDLADLTFRERLVVNLTHGLGRWMQPRSGDEIARLLSSYYTTPLGEPVVVSEETVRRIRLRAMQKLREVIQTFNIEELKR